MIWACFICLGVLDFIGLCALVMIWAMSADLAHSIEDIKHLTMLRAVNGGDGKVSEESMARFLNPKPTMEGDVRFHIPSSLLNRNED